MAGQGLNSVAQMEARRECLNIKKDAACVVLLGKIDLVDLRVIVKVQDSRGRVVGR